MCTHSTVTRNTEADFHYSMFSTPLPIQTEGVPVSTSVPILTNMTDQYYSSASLVEDSQPSLRFIQTTELLLPNSIDLQLPLYIYLHIPNTIIQHTSNNVNSNLGHGGPHQQDMSILQNSNLEPIHI